MNESISVLGAVLPVFALAVVGLVIRKVNWLTAQADASLLRVNINLLLPCLIIDSTMRNAALRDPGNLLLAPVIGFATASGGMSLAYALRRFAGPRDDREGRTFAVSVGLYNYGFIPIPLAMLMFGSDTVGVLCVHNVGVEISVWTTAIVLLSGAKIGSVWKNILNAPLLAIVIGLILNWTRWGEHVPEPAQRAVRWLAECAIPMSLILAGATVADHVHEFHARHGHRVIGLAVLLRLGVLPMLFLLIGVCIPASTELKRVIVLQAAMTSAVFPIVMARYYGGDPATAVRAVLATSALGLVTIPFWIRFGLKALGLEA